MNFMKGNFKSGWLVVEEDEVLDGKVARFY